MFKALLKKQLYELLALYFSNAKNGKRRTKAGMAALVALFIVLFSAVGVTFYGMLDAIAAGLIAAGLDWLFFSLAAIMAILFGTIGSVFSTYSGLYHAKDNELLLAMPIHPMKILASRMVPIAVSSFVYSSIPWIPTLIRYAVSEHGSALSLISGVIMTVFITFIVTTVSCALGWIVALISGKLKNKSALTVIISLVLIGGYYFLSYKLTDYIGSIVANGEKIGDALRKWAYPIYQIGMGAAGDIVGLLITAGLTFAVFALCVLILSRNFIRIVTTNSGSKKKVYREKSAKAASPARALFRRELKRFTSSSTYMLNCGLGLIFIPAVTIVLFVKSDITAKITAEIPDAAGFIHVILCALLCLMASTCMISAPSVSLEGKSLWIVRSLPVRTEDVLFAKVRLHLTICLPPVTVCTVLCGIAADADALTAAAMTACSTAFTVTAALAGLWFNLLKPNLSWTSEMIPVKQGASVVITMFGGWALALAVGGLYFLLSSIEGWLYLLMWTAVLTAVCAALVRVIKTKGKELFETL